MIPIPQFQNRKNKSYQVDEGVIWGSRSVAICAVVTATIKGDDTTYVLIEKRGKGAPNFRGAYCLVCGYLDWGETAAEAMLRETWEETGINLQYEAELGRCSLPDQPVYVHSEPKGNMENVTLQFRVALNVDKLPSVTTQYAEPDEVDEVLWMPVSEDELGKYRFAFDHDEVIRRYLF